MTKEVGQKELALRKMREARAEARERTAVEIDASRQKLRATVAAIKPNARKAKKGKRK